MANDDLALIDTGDCELNSLLCGGDEINGLPLGQLDNQKKIIESAVILLEGTAGAGKTTLALQIASHAAKGRAAEGTDPYSVIFLSLEQSTASLKKTANGFGFPSDVFKVPTDPQGPQTPAKGTVLLSHLSPLPLAPRLAEDTDEVFKTRFAELEHIVGRLQASDDSRFKLFVLDSLNAFTGGLLTRSQIYQIFTLFRSKKIPIIATLEQPDRLSSPAQSFFQVESFLADMVIRLTREFHQEHLHCFLEVPKSRLCLQGLGKHLFKTRTKDKPELICQHSRTGVVVYPSVSFIVWRTRSESQTDGTSNATNKFMVIPYQDFTIVGDMVLSSPEVNRNSTSNIPITELDIRPLPVTITESRTNTFLEPMPNSKMSALTKFLPQRKKHYAITGALESLRHEPAPIKDFLVTEDLETVLLENEVARPACFGIIGPAGTHKLALGLNLGIGYVEQQSKFGIGYVEEKAKLLVVTFGGQGEIDFHGVAWTYKQRYLRNLTRTRKPEVTTKHHLASYEARDEKTGRYTFVTVLTFYIGVLTPEECLYSIEQILNEAKKDNDPFNSVLFSETAELCTGFPLLSKDPMFFAAMLDLFESSRLVTVGIGVADDGHPNLREINLTLMAKATHRIVLRHFPNVEKLMGDRIEAMTDQQKLGSVAPKSAQQKLMQDQQYVSMVIDNVAGRHYARQPKWIIVKEEEKGTPKELRFAEFKDPPLGKSGQP